MAEKENIAKIETGLAAVNARDVAGFTRLLEPGFKLHLLIKPEQLMPHGQKSGADAFADYLNMLYTAFPDFHIEQVNIRAGGNMVHQEVKIHGAQRGPLALPNGITLPPSGMQVNIPVEVFHTFNASGGFIGSTGYVNLLDIARQFRL
jgi:predicted ester cyclase